MTAHSQFKIQHLKLIALSMLFLFNACAIKAQALNIDSVRTALQGQWRMNADTNVVLVFTGDSMTHRMVRSWGHGKSHFAVTNHNCDTTRFVKKDALYIVETYRYYHGTQPMDGELCNKIIFFKNNSLILKRDGLFESYTRVQ
jgi:hypothetical protein